MAKSRLSKTELKKQKDILKRLQRYLPMLQIKKQQLQLELHRINSETATIKKQRNHVINDLNSWIAVFGEDAGINDLTEIKEVKITRGNIAGIEIPVFNEIVFETVTYDLFLKPLWIDTAIDVVRNLMVMKEKLNVLAEQFKRINKELRTITQRVNLFEKVKIPEAQKNLRIIHIYLGDQETAAVVRGKIAKKKLRSRLNNRLATSKPMVS